LLTGHWHGGGLRIADPFRSGANTGLLDQSLTAHWNGYADGRYRRARIYGVGAVVVAIMRTLLVRVNAGP